MKFKKYDKIYRLGTEDVEDILLGHCYIQEKIDGANVSLYMSDGRIKMASRNQEIVEGFNGFCDYVKDHQGIQSLLKENPDYRLYSEWLIKHSVQYKETAYRKMYLFDIMCGDKFFTIDEVYNIANQYNIETPKLFGCIKNPTTEYIKEITGQSELGDKGEGIVIKNMDFINKFGHRVYAKMVTEKFKETNAITFGGNNKHSDSYWEMWVVNKYITLARVQKIIHKIQPLIDKRLNLEHTPRVASTVIHDMITEEAYEIFKKVPAINYRLLKRLASKKAIQIYHDILNDDISIADKKDG